MKKKERSSTPFTIKSEAMETDELFKEAVKLQEQSRKQSLNRQTLTNEDFMKMFPFWKAAFFVFGASFAYHYYVVVDL